MRHITRDLQEMLAITHMENSKHHLEQHIATCKYILRYMNRYKFCNDNSQEWADLKQWIEDEIRDGKNPEYVKFKTSYGYVEFKKKKKGE